MSREARELIEAERLRLRRLVGSHLDLIIDTTRREPALIELEGLATVLHSFYGGVERIMRTIALHSGEALPDSGSWHADLLNAMCQSSAGRPALFHGQLPTRLRDYLGFRHVFRGVYGFELDWGRMRPLVIGLEGTLSEVEASIDNFLAGWTPRK